MAREYAIPSTSTILQDFGLAVSAPPTTRNRRVVIIGTAEDGPLYEPVRVDVPTDSEYVWGRQTEGDLVRGVFECWYSQPNNQNIVGVRIGNAKKSILEIGEMDGNGKWEEDSDSNITSLRLEGRFAGPIYDQITIERDVDGAIAIYNPKTRLTSTFTVNPKNPRDTTVDATNVANLVAAINNDRNMNSVLVADYDVLTTNYELQINNNVNGVTSNADQVTLQLPLIMAESGVIATGDSAYIVPNPDLPYDINEEDANCNIKNLTVTNNLVELKMVEGIGISDWQVHSFAGRSTNLQLMPLDGKGTNKWDTIEAMMDYDADSKYTTNPSGAVVSEIIYSLNRQLIDELPTNEKGYDDLNVFNVTVDFPLDDTESPYIATDSGVVFDYLSSNIEYSDYSGASGEYELARCVSIKTKKLNGEDVRPMGITEIYVSDTLEPQGQWTRLPYHPESGVYMKDYTYNTAQKEAYVTFGIGADAYKAYGIVWESGLIPSGCNQSGSYTTNMSGINDVYFENGDNTETKWTNITRLVDEYGNIKEGMYIRVVANTVKGFINEVETLGQLDAITTPKTTHYFVRGQELLTNSAPKHDMIFNYGTRKNYEIGTEVVLSDNIDGEIKFLDPTNLPGPGGGPIDDSILTHIRLYYDYLPNFPYVVPNHLTGGTAGNKLSVKQREEELRKAYDYLRNYEGDIWVPMGAFIDEVKEDFNKDTGLLENMSNTFALDIEDFLEEQSINLYQPHAVLGVTQLEDVSQGAVNDWITNLTEYDVDRPERGANVMNGIQNKFISVAAFEPVFLNTGRGLPYASNGQAAYAGEIASLPYDISPTNKTISSVSTLRYKLNMRQLEALNGNRYVTMRSSDSRPPVIVNDITAAPYGSDYVNWSIFSITKEAADRIKRLADSYIGRPNSIEIRNALDQDISNILKNMTGIQAFNFSIASTIEQQVLGVVEIDLVIVPVFTMKKIRTTIKLRKNISLS